VSIELELREQAVKRGWPHNELLNAAADRIEALEAALSKIRDMPVGEFRPLTSEIEIWNIARAALETKGE
jgi:hypothetical protein